MRILVVEDSSRLRGTLASALRKSGYAVDTAGDGEEGLWAAENNDYDAIVLDIMLPKRDGLSVLAGLRRGKNNTHVLLLTARDTVADRVRGLRAGADDYLTKPFALDELLARVEALCRRAYGTKRTVLKTGDLELDTVARSVRRGGTAVELSAREYSLLEYMAARQGHVVTRAEIEAHIYDGAADPMSNVVDSAVCLLRKKLGAGGAPPPHSHAARTRLCAGRKRGGGRRVISIRTRLTRELLCAVILLLCAGATVYYFELRDAATEQFDATLKARALAVMALSGAAESGGRGAVPSGILPMLEGRKGREYFQITDERGGTVVASKNLSGRAALPFRGGVVEKPVCWNLPLPNGGGGRAVSFAFAQGAGAAGRTLRLVAASDRDDLDETLGGSLWMFAALGAVLVVATVVIIPLVLRHGLRPLGRLGEDAARIDAGSLATRFDAGALPAELQPIASGLNELLGRLHESFERERRFGADLAHELRTPLAELRSIAECALKWPESRDPATDRETLEIARHMERIVTNMLALARGEDGRMSIRLEPVELGPLLAEVWQPLAALAGRRRLETKFPPAPGCCRADAGMLRSVISNLCENAAEYTTEGGAFSVSVRHDGGMSAISFSNDTADLTPADTARLFERFWRKDASRTGGVHAGIGLSLARALAQATGWSLSTDVVSEGGRTRVVFVLAGPFSPVTGGDFSRA